MNTIFSTFLLVLVLPGKLNGGITPSPTLVEISHDGARPTNSSTIEAIFLLNSSTSPKGHSTGQFSTVNTGIVSIDTAKDMKTQNVPSSKRDLEDQQFSVMSQSKRQTSMVGITTRENKSPLHSSSLGPLRRLTRESSDTFQYDQITITTSKEKLFISKKAITTMGEHQTSHTMPHKNIKSTDGKDPTDTLSGYFQTTADLMNRPTNSSTIEAIFLLNSSTNTKGSYTGLTSAVNTRNVGIATEKKDLKAHKITTRDIVTKAQQDTDKHATESTTQNAISSSKLPSEIFSVMSDTKGQTTIARISTGDSKSSSHLSSQGPLREWMQESLDASLHNQTSTSSNKNILTSNEEFDLVEHQIMHTMPNNHTKSTDMKGPTDNPSRYIQTTPEVVTTEPQKVPALPLTEVQTSKHSAENQENQGTKFTTLPTKDSEGTVVNDSAQTQIPALISSSKTKTTFPQKNATNPTETSIYLISSINTESITTTTAKKGITSGKQDSIGTTTEEKTPSTNHAPPTTQPGKTQATKPKAGTIKQTAKTGTSKPPRKKNEIEAWKPSEKHNASKNDNPGLIVASVITSALILMFIAIVLILVMKYQRKKKQMNNTDWAGPSPFLEGNVEPNQPKVDESELFHRSKSKKISLHSFLPLRLSNRLSMLPEDELHMVDIPDGRTFGRNGGDTVLPQDAKVEVEKDHIQSHETDQSPPPECLPSDFPATKTMNAPTAPANSVSIQSSPDHDETIPFTASEKNTVAPPPTHFEDVDLDPALEQTSESAALPTPPPPPPQ